VTRTGVWKTVGSVAVSPTFPLWMRRLGNDAGDVMVVHEPNPVAIVAHALVRPKSRLIVWIHAEVVRPQWRYKVFYRPFLRRLLTLADRIVVASPPMIDVAEELKDFRAKAVVIPYAIDPDQYAHDPNICERARRIRAERQEPIVLFVGRMVPYKGVDVLLRALPGVNARTVLVGEGPLKAAWQQLAADLGVSDRVEFPGEVDTTTLGALYHACDVFVLPSVTRAEAFGMVQLEAMACRKPVISTALPSGVPWVNQHGETGLVVPPGDAMALRDALNTLVADADLRARMGERGRARVVQDFSIERMSRQTAELYENVQLENLQLGIGNSLPVPFGKRFLDIVLSGIGLLISSPLWLALAAAIKLEDGGPVFYTQDRVGEGGGTFKVFKFRSMIVNAEAAVGALQATEADPRITRIGRLMRATAMDELPQLWNIFIGDMTFVGPRALRPGEIEAGDGEFIPLDQIPGYAERCRLRPGLTGVAQIYAPRDVGRRNKFRFDRVYAKRESFWLDVRLIALSFWITFRGRWEHRGEKV
jgi:rhamnosyl/mannosyltransferase